MERPLIGDMGGDDPAFAKDIDPGIGGELRFTSLFDDLGADIGNLEPLQGSATDDTGRGLAKLAMAKPGWQKRDHQVEEGRAEGHHKNEDEAARPAALLDADLIQETSWFPDIPGQ